MDPNLQIKSSPGCKELLLKKLSYAVTTSVLSQILILTVFIFGVNFTLLHPCEWLSLTWITLTSFSTWIFAVPFLSVIFAQCIICAKDYVLKSPYDTSRIQRIMSALSMRNIVLLGLHMFSGGLLTWLYVSLARENYGSVFVECEKNTCLNINSFYLILCGLWSGLYFFVCIYKVEKRILFPVIQQPKLLHFKSRLMPLIKDSLKMAFWPVLYYIILYGFVGNVIQNYVSNMLNTHISDISFSYVTILFSWVYSTIYIFIMNLMHFFFELYLTEPINFPIVNTNKDDLTLSDALCINNIPVVQHLASFDLFNLSRNSMEKRKILFMLSQPGNHPHNWNNLITNSLRLITDYTDRINAATNSILNPDTDKKTDAPVINTPLQPLPNNYLYNIRNLGLQNLEIPLDVVNVTHSKNPPFFSPIRSCMDFIIGKINVLIVGLKAKFGKNYLFQRLPLKDLHRCLEDGQIIIWVTQGISNMTIASLKEDSFGIVQKDLPIILSVLVELKQSIEKLNRIPAFTRKTHILENFSIKMKAGINSAVKRSLYNMCKHFGPYINDIPLKKEILQHLQLYIIEN